MVPIRGGLCRISAPSAMAGRLPLSGVRRGQSLADEAGPASMRQVSTTDVGDRWQSLVQGPEQSEQS